MSKTLYMMRGLPASGKSTRAKQMLAEFGKGNAKRICKDDLRAMLDAGEWSHDNEKFLLGVRDYIIGATLNAGKHVIVDDTNLAPKHAERLKQLAKQHSAAFEVVDFAHISVEECIARDRQRANYTGEAVIQSMYDQFLRPAPPMIADDQNLQACVIVDVDGTVAKMNGRGPFDWTRVNEDEPRLVVVDTVRAIWESWQSVRLIFLSGRDECCREDTDQWLQKHFGRDYFCLYMRAAGDMRKDSIVKRELFEAYIAGKYRVLAIFDDRPQVVRLWREMGYGDRLFNVGDGREF